MQVVIRPTSKEFVHWEEEVVGWEERVVHWRKRCMRELRVSDGGGMFGTVRAERANEEVGTKARVRGYNGIRAKEVRVKCTQATDQARTQAEGTVPMT